MDNHSLKSADRVWLTVGTFSFSGRFERQASPEAVALLMSLLPLEGHAMHARWSGEAGWMPLGSGLSVPPENALAYPQPGQLLLYAGALSEPELLIPYGACSFACRAGQLAGSHVITLDEIAQLRPLGETLLNQGAQPVKLTTQDPAQPTL